MAYLDFVTALHNRTRRNYLERVVEHDKAQCSAVAGRYGFEYWDGDRRYGYGGYRYDGRWRSVAEAMVAHYGLEGAVRILDVGCGKGFLLYEFSQILPQARLCGLDCSGYALRHAKPEMRGRLVLGHARSLPFPDRYFDFVVSLTTLHNLYNYELFAALGEIERVSRGGRYITVESYRNEQEKANLLYWQLTCRSFYTPEEWQWFMDRAGYTGDYGCIFFE